MMTRMQTPELAHIAQVTTLRNELVQDLLSYYQQFLNKDATEPATLYDTARTYRMTGDLHMVLGRRDQAEADLRNSIAILDKLTAQFPDNPDQRQVLAALTILGEANIAP